jgi:hypothetical protein
MDGWAWTMLEYQEAKCPPDIWKLIEMEALMFRETQEYYIQPWWEQESLFLVVVDLQFIKLFWLELDTQLLEDNLETFRGKNRKQNF